MILLLIIFASPVISHLMNPPYSMPLLLPLHLCFTWFFCPTFFLPLPLRMLPMCLPLLHHSTFLQSFFLLFSWPSHPLTVESLIVSSHLFSLSPAHLPLHFCYHHQGTTVPPPRLVIYDSSLTIDPTLKVSYPTYFSCDRSTLHPLVRYAITSTSLSDVLEQGTYRKAVQSLE